MNIFDKYYRKYDAWYDKNKFAYLSELEALKKVIPKKGKGLEIGVGTGRFAGPLKIAVGIDPSEKMLEIARKRGIDVRLGTGEKLPFKDSAFDYVALIITICFVHAPCRVLLEAKRVLKKNGRIIIAVIDKDSFLGKFYQKKKSLFYKQANFFSVNEITNLLSDIGFSGISYYQTLYKRPDKIKAIQPPQKGFGRGGFVVITGTKPRGIKTKVHPLRGTTNGLYRKFRQYEKIKALFREYGYDMEKARLKVLLRAGKIEEPVLDLGTGPGRMACALAKAGFHLTTVDISKKVQAVAGIYARQYGVLNKIRFIRMDAEKLKFKDKSFSMVISSNLLHDVKRPEKVVQEMIRVTKAGGKIIVSDLNRKGRLLVNKVYRLNRDVHRGKLIDLEKVAGGTFKKAGIPYRKYDDGYITTFVAQKIKGG